ncbi:MAG: methyltransferase [Rhodobacteraceae bacterium]|nr:methyltransferase [Paracoccaceae bacterium]
MNNFLKNEISQDLFLGGQLSIFQPLTGYRAATDPVLLAAACPAKSSDEVLELGCGVGTASFCIFRRIRVSLTGLEIQENYANLAIENGLLNKIPIHVEIGDFRKMPKNIKNKNFDQVVINPPYYQTGTPSKNQGRNQSLRITNPLSEWVNEGVKRLKPNGWITIINTPENLIEILIALSKGTGDIQIKPLTSLRDKTANRVIIRAKKGSKGITKLYAPLITHVSEGNIKKFSYETEEILRRGSPLIF